MEISEFVIVNDGQSTWIANQDKLIEQLDVQGWEKFGIHGEKDQWIEPEMAEPGEAYTNLCGRVPEADFDGDRDELPTFSFCPAITPNGRVWILS